MKLFYDHIVVIHEIHSQIEEMMVDEAEKEALVQIIEDLVQHTVLHKILDHLHEDKHEIFLTRFQQAPHDTELIDYLRSHVPDIETRIKDAADEVKYELISLIRQHGSG